MTTLFGKILMYACFAWFGGLIALALARIAISGSARRIGAMAVTVRKNGVAATLVIVIFICGMIVYGSTKNNSQTNGPPPRMQMRRMRATPIETETPSVRALTPADYAAGFALSRIGTNETHGFFAPAGARVCEDWRRFGAAKDWFSMHFTNDWTFAFGTNAIDALTVFSYGKARPHMKDLSTFISPFETSLGIVPEANWATLAQDDTNILHSRFWYHLTPTNTLVMTWQNALLDRDANCPVSIQVECWPGGRIVFRYDLSQVPNETVSNLVVGVRNEGEGRVFTALPRNTTSLEWERLDPNRPDDPDPDDDGITTDDEVLVYHTNPYAADTDMDGLTDYREIFETLTDPNNPHSLSESYCDGVAMAIGDVDPFSYPAGSTNTVWEHVFYTGTTNMPFAYPQSDDAVAVLRVTVGGSGSGELIVGDRVVPLLGHGFRTDSLSVTVAKGSDTGICLRGGSGLSLELDSDDFAFGRLPGSAVFPASSCFVNFPNTKAEAPCIHDFNARKKLISLPVLSGADDLTATWSGPANVRIENLPPRSAMITASFSARTSSGITYTLSHPFYLFGRRTFGQEVRFCPKPKEPDADHDPGSEPMPSWFDEGEDDPSDDDVEHDGRWCCYWGTCCYDDGTCSCGCDCCGSQGEGGWSEGEEPEETCPWHHVPYEQCAPRHDYFYTNAVWRAEECRDVLKIRDPLEYSSICLPCPDTCRRCCDCPDHCTNYVAVAYKSCRLGLIDENGDDFGRSVDPCTVRVAGVRPSSSVGDAMLGFVTNGVVFRSYNYTVLGVGISKSVGPSLSVYNGLSGTMGVPMTITTNVNSALQLDLVTNVRLPSGNVQLSIDAADGGQFTVWIYDYGRWRYRRLLDTNGRSIINLSIANWRRLVGSSSRFDSPVTPIYITSAAKGRATLRFGYWGLTNGKIIQDWQSQKITSVDPPLLPDINNDGGIDATDVSLLLGGRTFRFWCNYETVKGDYVGHLDNDERNAHDREINGRYDLINFFPVSLDLSELKYAWGNRVTYRLESNVYDTNTFNFCYARIAKNALREMQTVDKFTLDGHSLHDAPLETLPRDGITLGNATIVSLCRDDAVIVAEAVTPYVTMRLVNKAGDTELYAFTAPFSIQSVRNMYRAVDLSGAVDNPYFVPRIPYQEPYNYPDSETDSTHYIFVHGYNVDSYDAMAWHDQMFKRFWWAGSRSGYTGVIWRGNESQVQLPYVGGVTPNYYINVKHALTTAPYLANVVGVLPGLKKFMGAHSLGNLLVASAIVDHALMCDKYFMFDAAVALEAYDVTSISTITKNNMTPANWRAYSDRVRASHWFELFDAEDARHDLTWHGRFSSLTNAVNYYSSEEDVLENSDGQTHSIASASYAWMNQETKKGVWPIFLPGNNEAGWGVNSFYMVSNPYGGQGVPLHIPYTPAQADLISTNSLVIAPFFAPFDDMSICMTNRLEDVPAKYQLLSDAIPAESYAAGRNPVPSWGVIEESCQNIDMVIFKKDCVNQPWLHGFLKDCSFMLISDLFEDLEQKKGK